MVLIQLQFVFSANEKQGIPALHGCQHHQAFPDAIPKGHIAAACIDFPLMQVACAGKIISFSLIRYTGVRLVASVQWERNAQWGSQAESIARSMTQAETLRRMRTLQDMTYTDRRREKLNRHMHVTPDEAKFLLLIMSRVIRAHLQSENSKW